MEIFENLSSLSEAVKNTFSSFEEQKQKSFLLHPDISSLLQEIHLTQDKPSEEKFIKTLEEFCEGNVEALVMNLGEDIPGTNIKLTLEDNNPHNNVISHPGHSNE